MKLIVGLGNPEPEYDMTRHNIGFMVLNSYAERTCMNFQKKFNAFSFDFMHDGEKIIVMKPDTYMNNSGEAVQKFMKFYNIDVSDILVIHDDLDLDFNITRLKKNSSSGGQNGVKSIISHIKTQDFLRLKIGIKNEHKRDVKNFVLGHFSKMEQKELNSIYEFTNNVIDDFISGLDANELMNKYN